MSKQYVCDRCDLVIRKDEPYGLGAIRRGISQSIHSEVMLDLCGRCFQDLNVWVDGFAMNEMLRSPSMDRQGFF